MYFVEQLITAYRVLPVWSWYCEKQMKTIITYPFMSRIMSYLFYRHLSSYLTFVISQSLWHSLLTDIYWTRTLARQTDTLKLLYYEDISHTVTSCWSFVTLKIANQVKHAPYLVSWRRRIIYYASLREGRVSVLRYEVVCVVCS